MNAYLVATRYSLLELARNRLAVVVLVCLVPLLIWLVDSVVTGEPVEFVHRSTDTRIQALGHQVTALGCVLNLVSLLVGFAMFTAAHRSADFDRRLARVGYPRTALILAKLTMLVVASATVSGYATAWTSLHWTAEQPLGLWAGLFLGGTAYGAIGLFLALFLPEELEGTFVIIVATVIDNALQNPIINPTADADAVLLLPGYGAMQVCVAGAFTDTVPLTSALLSLGWAALFGAVALGAFAAHTRDRTPQRVGGPPRI
ncbi:hypothetical protein [Nocardiopsis valliformis]|uniref:hypothetical protein n=1 Tax=Nocardiopsis valliformis TaxID=239974 RepID=UPI00034C8AAE|nr:hypothetical protein [Nocardiopsis valliformis]